LVLHVPAAFRCFVQFESLPEAAKAKDFCGFLGAGEGIRTPDPNLGKGRRKR
jgi:hypothetical protein